MLLFISTLIISLGGVVAQDQFSGKSHAGPCIALHRLRNNLLPGNFRQLTGYFPLEPFIREDPDPLGGDQRPHTFDGLL